MSVLQLPPTSSQQGRVITFQGSQNLTHSTFVWYCIIGFVCVLPPMLMWGVCKTCLLADSVQAIHSTLCKI
jgi:hypothetical protein